MTKNPAAKLLACQTALRCQESSPIHSMTATHNRILRKMAPLIPQICPRKTTLLQRILRMLAAITIWSFVSCLLFLCLIPPLALFSCLALTLVLLAFLFWPLNSHHSFSLTSSIFSHLSASSLISFSLLTSFFSPFSSAVLYCSSSGVHDGLGSQQI